MTAEDILKVRSILAEQPAVAEARATGLRRGLKGILAFKRPPSLVQPSPLALAPAVAETDPVGAFEAAFTGPPGDVTPPELLLGDLAPRRARFGRRVEAVLELERPAPAQPQRLTLLAADGASVGEIILHERPAFPATDVRAGGGGTEVAANGPAAPCPCEPLYSQAPFFPDDLADEPPARLRKPTKVDAAASAPPVPSPELAAAFLLANLAARLAGEEAALRRRLLAAQSCRRVA